MDVLTTGNVGRNRFLPMRELRLRALPRSRRRACPPVPRATASTSSAPPSSGRGILAEHHEEVSVAADWAEEARAAITEPGDYLAFDDEAGDVKVVALGKEWTRMGRSLAADVRFDDPTVSRRHALFVRQADGVRVLDDRSLNGVFVNGERVEWSTLTDGDEVTVGRHVLRFFTLAPASAAAAPAEASAV